MNSLFYIALGYCTHKLVSRPELRQKSVETATSFLEAIKLGWRKGAEPVEEVK